MADPAPPGAPPRTEELEGPAAAGALDIAGGAPIQMAPGKPKKKEFIPRESTCSTTSWKRSRALGAKP